MRYDCMDEFDTCFYRPEEAQDECFIACYFGDGDGDGCEDDGNDDGGGQSWPVFHRNVSSTYAIMIYRAECEQDVFPSIVNCEMDEYVEWEVVQEMLS